MMTEKQKDFILEINDKLGYPFDFENATKQTASQYISAHIDEFKQEVNKDPFYYTSDWALVNGYY